MRAGAQAIRTAGEGSPTTSVPYERPLLTAAELSGLGGAQAVATDNAQNYRDAASQITASASLTIRML